GQKSEEREECRHQAVDNADNDEGSADISRRSTHETHDTNLIFRDIDSETDGVESNENGNRCENNGGGETQAVCGSNNLGELVYRNLVLEIVDAVDDGHPSGRESVAPFEELCDRFVLSRITSLNV